MFGRQIYDAQVLVIEPSRLFQDMIEKLLVARDLGGVYCASAKEAEILVKTHNFSIIIIANSLPETDGLTLAKQLRKQINETTVILLLITSSEQNIVKQAIKSGVTEVIERARVSEISIYLNELATESEKLENQTITILSVEDSVPVADLTESHFVDLGFNVISVPSAEECLALIQQQSIDIVITDILLSGNMNGISLIRTIRQLKSDVSNLPILAVSGLNNYDQRIEALKQGANDFIDKPVNLTELSVRAKNLVKSSRMFQQLKEKEQQLREMAVTDPLTQLYNRHYLTEVGLKRFGEAQRHRQAVSMLMIDIDHFKYVNDHYGHLTGDSVLQQVATVLKQSCRKEDFAVRFGGEEFIIILPYSSPQNATIKAEQLRQTIEQLRPDNIDITISIGVSGFTEENPHHYVFSDVFKLADEAVFKAKAEGRNRVCVIEQ